jgi:hypothetical protein
MTAIDVKRYIRYIADRRLTQLSLQPIYRSDAKNPLPWMDPQNAEQPNRAHQFSSRNRATEYTQGLDPREDVGRGVQLSGRAFSRASFRPRSGGPFPAKQPCRLRNLRRPGMVARN